MASFTDQIPQFNPYVQQLPVEAMTQVGMMKQAQYDQGIQTIQAKVDSVAGLDVINDVDKKYLRAKLSNLQTDLRKVAAGDFSNFQLVNKVGGMVGSIARDENVQTAVRSTQTVRKGQMEMDEAKKNGKSSPQNEFDWNDQVNEYLKSTEVGTSFNGAYTQYTDIGAKLREITKDMPEMESVQDIPLQRDNMGNVLYFDKNGKPTTSENGSARTDVAMLRISSKGKSAQKILDNFLSSLDGNDKKQLEIDGRYAYRGATKETFQNDIVGKYNAAQDRATERVAAIAVELKTNNNLSSVDKLKLESEMNDYNKMLKDNHFENAKQSELDSLDKIADIEQYKKQLYTQNFLGNLAGAMSYESKKLTYETNPYKQVELQYERLNLDYKRLRDQNIRWGKDYDLKFEIHEFNKAIAMQKAGGADSPSVPEGLDPKNLSGLTVETFEAELDDVKLQKETLKHQIKNKLYKDLDPDAAEQAINELLSQELISPSITSDYDLKESIEHYRRLENDEVRKTHILESVRQKSQVFEDQLEEHMKSLPSLVMPSQQGIAVKVSAKDVAKVIDLKNDYIIGDTKTTHSTTGIGNINLISFNREGFLSEFPRGTPLYKVAEVIADAQVGQKGSNNEGWKRAVFNYSVNLERDLNSDVKLKSILNKKKELEKIELGKHSFQFQSGIATLDMNNKVTERQVTAILGNSQMLHNLHGSLDLSDKQKFDPNKIANWRTGKTKDALVFALRKKGNGSGDLLISLGEEMQTIPMNNAVFSDHFPNESQVSNTKHIRDLASSEFKTTNAAGIIGKSEGARYAYLSGYQLPLLQNSKLASKVKLDVEGSENNIGDPRYDRFQIRLYVYDESNKVWKHDIYDVGGLIYEAGLLPAFSTIGEKEINRILKSK